MIKRFEQFVNENYIVDTDIDTQDMSEWILYINSIVEELSPEDKELFLQEVTDNFGDDIANIIDSKLTSIQIGDYVNNEIGELNTKNFIKMFPYIKDEIESFLFQ